MKLILFLKSKILREDSFFLFILLIGLVPLISPKYFLTLDGAAHFYNGTIIKELITGKYPNYSELFTLNQLPVPNWSSHFLFAFLSLFLPGFISEKLILGSYLILFPFLFRRIILFFAPENKAFTYIPVLFAHNHLFYFGFYNLVLAFIPYLVIMHYILSNELRLNLRTIFFLSLLLIATYFSHIMVYALLLPLLIILPLKSIKISKEGNKLVLSNWHIYFSQLKLIGVSLIPSLLLAINYFSKIDSLEQAGRLNLDILLQWLIDIRPLLTLCYCKDWSFFTHILLGLFIVLIITVATSNIRSRCSISDHKLSIQLSKPRFNLIWLLLSLLFLFFLLIVPNANLLPDRIVLITFIFFILWISTQKYPLWIHRLAMVIVITIHIVFVTWHTRAQKKTSNDIEMMLEVTAYIPEGSLLLPFNYAKDNNWLHSHSTGYLGSEKPIVVIENYEAQLQWFPIKWNIEGDYNLDQLNVWGVQNKKITTDFFLNPQNPDIFSLPLKNGSLKEIEYVTIIGRPSDKNHIEYNNIHSVLEKSYTNIFQNDFCVLYQLK